MASIKDVINLGEKNLASQVKWKRDGNSHITATINEHSVIIFKGRFPSCKIDDGEWVGLWSGPLYSVKAQTIRLIQKMDEEKNDTQNNH